MFIMNLMFFILLFITFILMLINFFISKKKMTDREKSTPFECGFDPFSNSRLPFSIQFYMISMIFLIFDIEIIIFLPLIPALIFSSIKQITFILLLFLLILVVSLYVEWNDGALNWIK
uniref:NADH-ubiquinone oxidoreductase chain 3 n=1 Tax=Hypsicera sp. ZJUH_2016019 TaxID=2491161 RepID=A0A3Q8UA48_9HYME|nr:NADH dehydrogenase subunit 3 [Hypsicera sp. ZJUH_2016019]